MAKAGRKKRKSPGAESCQSAGQPQIHIEIDAKGNIVLETVGTIGNQCDLLAGALENSLGSLTCRLDKENYHDG